MKDFYDLFIRELKNIYGIEEQLVEALPKLASAAKSEKLKEAIKNHLEETKMQLKRLEMIGEELNVTLAGQPATVITAMIKDGEKLLAADMDIDVRDAAIIAAGQKIEHLEIACYGILKAYAKHFKLDNVIHLLEESSKEEGHANKRLTEIAEGSFFATGINKTACKKCA